MRKVKWTDGPGHDHELDFIRPGKKNRDVADRVVLPPDPEIAYTLRFALVLLIHESFPPRRAILLAHRSQSSRVILPRSRKVKPLDRDPAHACNHATKILVVRVQLGREHQHRMVKGELALRRGALPQSLNPLRKPDALLLRFGRSYGGECNQKYKHDDRGLHGGPQLLDEILSRAVNQDSC